MGFTLQEEESAAHLGITPWKLWIVLDNVVIVQQEDLCLQSEILSSRPNVIRKMAVSGRGLMCQYTAQDKAVRYQMWSKDKKTFNIECYIRMDTSQGIKVWTQENRTNLNLTLVKM